MEPLEPKNNPMETETKCPACGHFAGIHEYCPRCGTYVPKRMTIKFFKYFSLALSVVGLFCIYLWVIHREPTEIKVNQITETMNFASVMMKGDVTREAKMNYDANKKPAYLSFSMNDGTGEIRVIAYRNVAEKLANAQSLPARGDEVTMVGQLRVKAEQNISIVLQSVEQFKLTRERIVDTREAPRVPLAQITAKDVDKEYLISAKITQIREPRKDTKAPVVLQLSEGKSRAEMVLWPDEYQELKEKIGVKSGDEINARITVNEHRGRLQFKLKNIHALELLKGAAAALPPKDDEKPKPKQGKPKPEKQYVPIQKIDKSHLEKEVDIQGTIQSIRVPKKGTKAPYNILLSDASGKAEIVVWQSVYEEIAQKMELKVGLPIVAHVSVGEYKGKLQLSLKNAEDLKLQGKEEENEEEGKEPQAPPLPIQKITKEMEGNEVCLQGRIVEKRKVQPGNKLTIQDATGKIDVMLWDRVFEGTEIVEQCGVGQAIRVKGTISVFKEKLQLQPQSTEDLSLVGNAEVLSFQTLSRVSKEHLGQVVTVRGRIVSRKEVKPGLSLLISDDTAKFGVMLFNRVFTDPTALAEFVSGKWVEVTGILSEHRNQLQIQPDSEKQIKFLKERPELPKEAEKPKEPGKPTERPPRKDPGKRPERSSKPAPLTPEEQKIPREFLDFVSYLKENHVGRLVQFKGIILSKSNVPEGEKLVFQDRSGVVAVILWDKIFKGSEIKDQLKERFEIRVRAKVIKHEGALYLEPQSPVSIDILKEADEAEGRKGKSEEGDEAYEKAPSKENLEKGLTLVTDEYLGKEILAQGKIIRAKEIKIGKQLVLAHKQSKAEVILSKKTFASHPIWEKAIQGSYMEVRGILGKFEGRFEMKPQSPEQVKMLEVKSDASTPDPTKVLEMADVQSARKEEHLGKTVSLASMIVDQEVISPGIKLTLGDDTGRIALIIQNRLLREEPDHYTHFKPGSKIKVVATVARYRTQMQLSLSKKEDLLLVESAPADYKSFSRPPVILEKDVPKAQDILWYPLSDLSNLAPYHGAKLLLSGKLELENGSWRLAIKDRSIALQFDGKYPMETLKGGEEVKAKGTLVQKDGQYEFSIHGMEK